MAVANGSSSSRARSAGPRRLLVGTNVVVTICLVIGVVAVSQLLAYEADKHLGTRWQMSSSGVGTVSEGTANILAGLDKNIRLTSLYFETDREEKDQQRYRRYASDLIQLYASVNPAKITAEWINPLKDKEELEALLARLRKKPAFRKEIEQYKAPVKRYLDEIDTKLRALIQDELKRIADLGSGMAGGQDNAISAIEAAFAQRTSELENARELVDSAMRGEIPQYGRAITELKALYPAISQTLKDVADFAKNQAQANQNLSPEQLAYLQEAGNRFAEVVAALEQEYSKLQELSPLKFDEIVRDLAPDANPIVVESDDNAYVVRFSSVWPPVDPGMEGTRVPFNRRSFQGHEKLTAAILRLVQTEQTAVIFSRYGGRPLFSQIPMPNQPPARFAQLKESLEDANFVVKEWDLKTSDAPPEIDPAPKRTIYIVLQPAPPQRGPNGAPTEPPMSEEKHAALHEAIEKAGRALFIAGWQPGPMGLAAAYEHRAYLTDEWGVRVEAATLLIETSSFAPGKYMVTRRDFYNMSDFTTGDHPIVKNFEKMRSMLPWCCPLHIDQEAPEGVERHELVILPKRDGVWGVRSLQAYEKQLREQEYLTKVPTDLEGPFLLAAAATKGDDKLVVISSRSFADDSVAASKEMAVVGGMIQVRSRAPGNTTLLLNSLHWLNDNLAFLDVGKPIDTGVLEVEAPTVKAVQALTIVIWPIIALCCGGVAWWVRRR